jgi:acetoin utilization protein AcuB
MEVAISMLVQDLMTRDVVTIPPNISALQALHVGQEHGVRHLPVVDSSGKLLGIVTDRDLRAAGPPVGASPARQEAVLDHVYVVEVMERAVITVHPSDPAEQTARELGQRDIGSLPVVSDEGEVVGIITASDMLQACARLLEGP